MFGALGHRCFPWTFSVAASRSYSFVVCRLLLAVASIVTEHRCRGSSSCDVVSTGAWAQQLWHTGLVALQPVESSWMREQTCILCIWKSKFSFFWYKGCVETTVKLPRILLLYLIRVLKCTKKFWCFILKINTRWRIRMWKMCQHKQRKCNIW